MAATTGATRQPAADTLRDHAVLAVGRCACVVDTVAVCFLPVHVASKQQMARPRCDIGHCALIAAGFQTGRKLAPVSGQRLHFQRVLHLGVLLAEQVTVSMSGVAVAVAVAVSMRDAVVTMTSEPPGQL